MTKLKTHTSIENDQIFEVVLFKLIENKNDVPSY